MNDKGNQIRKMDSNFWTRMYIAEYTVKYDREVEDGIYPIALPMVVHMMYKFLWQKLSILNV